MQHSGTTWLSNSLVMQAKGVCAGVAHDCTYAMQSHDYRVSLQKKGQESAAAVARGVGNCILVK